MAPIKYCEKMGYEDKDIVIDVVLSGNPHLPHALASFYNSFGLMKRTFEVQAYYQTMYGLIRAKDGHPEVDFRHVVGPNREMANKIVPVEITTDEVKKQMLLGKQDAKAAIA